MKPLQFFRMFVIALLGLFALLLALNNGGLQNALAQEGKSPGGQVQASSASVPQAQRVQLKMSSTPPELTAEQLEARKLFEQRGPLQGPPLPAGNTAVNRPDSFVDPNSQIAAPDAGSTALAPNAPGDFEWFRKTDISSGTIKSQSSRIMEPTVANSGEIVFATGNWFGAVSIDGGQTFSYVNPYTLFPSSYGGFCCDQIVVYDPARDVFLWYLQYVASGPAGSGQNIFRLAVASPPNASKGIWWVYDFASDVNTEYDYPDICLSNDFLWITTNRGPYGASFVDDAFMFKMPLDSLAVGAGFGYSFLDLDTAGLSNLSLRCTTGAHETMYFGSHNTLSQVRIFRWAENSGTIFYDDVNLSAAWNNAVHTCPGPDARDWCGFDDGRIKAGWVSQNRIGFMWGASQGGGFAYPYVEAVRVRESDRAYLDRPYIWTSVGSFAYPAAAPNARGDLGVAFAFGGGDYYPYFGVAIDDDYSRDNGYVPAPWNVSYVRTSTQGPIGNRWGDYLAVQPFAPTALGWIASGFTLQGCGGNGCAEMTYIIFGRERDLHSVTKYYNPSFGTFLPVLIR